MRRRRGCRTRFGGKQNGRKLAEIQDQLDSFRRVRNQETAADAFELLVKSHQQTDSGGAQEGNIGQVQANAVRACADYLVEIALQVLGPIIIEAPTHFHFDNFTELLCDDFHGGLRTQVLRIFRRNREAQLRRACAANGHFLHGYFRKRQVPRVRAL